MLEFERTYTIHKKVNLTPLIDIVFLLVIFFMLSSSFVQTEIMNLSFSETNASASVGKDQSILVRVLDNKRIELNDRKFTFREFPKKLSRLIADYPKRDIIVVAEKKVSVQGLVTTIDMIDIAGGKNVTIAK
jgi:biopolymer transport protein ExbD